MQRHFLFFLLFYHFLSNLFPEINQDLLEAVRNNDFDRSESLIKGGAEVNGQTQNIDDCPLFWAIDNENINLVMLLLAGGVDFKHVVESPYFGKMSIAEYALKHSSHKIAGIFTEVSGRLELNKKLIAAIEADDYDTVGKLIASCAEINAEFEFHHPFLWTPGKITIFEYAVALGRENIVELFIKNDINKNIEYAEYALQFAIAGKSLRLIELLIKNGGYRRIPLDVAAVVGNTEVISFLLKNKADPDAFYLNGHSAAGIALKNGNQEAALLLLLAETSLGAGLKDMYRAIYDNDITKIQELIAGGFDINQGWYTPLAWAAFLGKTDLVNLFIEHNALVHDEEKRPDFSPVFLAATNGNIDTVRILLKNGALIDSCDEYGWTMLHQAVKNGDAEMVDLLLKEKAGLGFAINGAYSHQDCPAGTPVHVAAALGKIQVLKTFFKNGLVIDYRKGEDGSPEHLTADTPLHYAARYGQADTVQFLLENGADINAKTYWGGTPLHEAAQSGNMQIIRSLIEKGAPIQAVDEEGRTPLSYALENGHLAVGMYLIQKGSDPKRVIAQHIYSDQFNLLHLACQKGYLQIAEFLIKHGENINSADKNGVTPLHYAVHNDHFEIARFLIAQGAEVNLITGRFNDSGLNYQNARLSALDLARSFKVWKLLYEAGARPAPYEK